MNVPLLLAIFTAFGIAGIIIGIYWSTKPVKKTVRTVASGNSANPNLFDLTRRLKESDSDDGEVVLWLKKSGNPKGWTIEDYKAAKISNLALYSLAGFGLMLVVMFLTQIWAIGFLAPIVALLGAWFGYGQPKRMLIGRAKKRIVQVQLQLPSLLTSIALADGAGYTPEAAIKLATDELPQGTLKGEMEIILQLLSTGASFSAALANFRERIDTPMVEEFTQKLYDGATTGQPLAKAMTDLAEVAFAERAAAMSLASKKASQKIMFIVVPALILPADVAVLLYPMTAQISGAL
jgi:Flp pilus assembly protein TadB